jgi:hypothetical protein
MALSRSELVDLTRQALVDPGKLNNHERQSVDLFVRGNLVDIRDLARRYPSISGVRAIASWNCLRTSSSMLMVRILPENLPPVKGYLPPRIPGKSTSRPRCSRRKHSGTLAITHQVFDDPPHAAA